jgi:mRNA interferase RelE/StbE
MRYEIILAPEAAEDLQSFKANVRAQIQDAIERQLRLEPGKTSKASIKRLRGVSRPQYRLRVGDDIRVFYDVSVDPVAVLAIVSKARANEWLERYGESDEEGGIN